MGTITDTEVIEAIKELMDRHKGKVTPKQVVAAARNDDRLHDRFEWDDSVAAEAWRIEQAKGILRFTVSVIDVKGTQARCFVSLKNENGYRAVEQVITSKILYYQMIADAREDMIAFTVRYKRIKELKGVHRAIKIAVSKIEKRRK